MKSASRRHCVAAVLALACRGALRRSRRTSRASSSCTRRSPSATPRRRSPHSSASQPGVEVEVFRSGTTEVMGKLAAEFSAGQPKPDVLLIADAATMESLKKDGRLLPYRAGEDRRPRRRARYDADRTYFGSKLITTGIAVNTGREIASRLVGRSREAGVQGPDRDAEPAVFRCRGDHARHDDHALRISAGATSRS